MIVFTSFLALYMPNIYNKKTEFVKVAKIFVFLPPFFILAFRYGVGVDYFHTYVPIFKTLSLGYNYEGVEIGYILLNKFILIFTDNYYWLFIITAFIFCYFIFKAIFEQSKYIGISTYIFLTGGLYFYSMNVVRQTICFAIFLYALKYIRQKNFKKYFIYIIIASFMHKTALIYLPLYFLLDLNIDYKKLIIIALTIVLSKNIVLDIISIFLKDTKYYNYITGFYADPSKSMMSPIINAIIIVMFLLIYKSKKDDREYRFYLNTHIVAFLISLLIGTVPLITRIFTGFYHIIILSIPYLVYQIRGKRSKELAILFIFLLFGLIFCYSIGIKNGNKVLPYQSIFSVIRGG